MNAGWASSIDPIGVGDIASLVWFALGRVSASRPALYAAHAVRAALRLRRR